MPVLPNDCIPDFQLLYLCIMTNALYDLYLKHRTVQTDTRKLQPGQIFFALKGPNFNANAFAQQALDAGAAGVVIDEDQGIDDTRIFLVPDALKALQDLAGYHRSQLNIPFLAITGSNGKTTTKELVSAVLSTTYKTSTTVGNLNNHIGVPLTILAIPEGTEIAVIEMGANHQKEIAGYCTYTNPTHGLITNCGKAHLEGFGGVEGVRKGKGELYDHLRANSGTAFVMWDYDYFHTMSKGIPSVITYGTHDAQFTGDVMTSEPFLLVKMHSGTTIDTIQTSLVGDYNLPNVLVAVTVGAYFKVPDEKIKQAIEAYQPTNSRSQLLEKKGNQFILDAYNANPSSMRLAIENFAKQQHPRKIVCIGGMMELGEDSIMEHEQILQLLQQYNWDQVILVGNDFSKVKHPYSYFDTADQAADALKQQQPSGAMILVKGSRSMKMENIMNAFE
jgi:UDP-N-acetylmuramoyl-tripeptide--D-alanyl-D-alanine ligase